MELTDYERKRNIQIDRNNKVLQSFGLPELKKSLFSMFHGKGNSSEQVILAKKRRNTSNQEESGSDYEPNEEETETDSDDIDGNSLGQMVQQKHGKTLARLHQIKPLINSKMAPGTRPQKMAKSSSNNESNSVSTRSRVNPLDNAHVTDHRIGRAITSVSNHLLDWNQIRDPQESTPSPSNSPMATQFSRLSNDITDGNSATHNYDGVSETTKQFGMVVSLQAEDAPTSSEKRKQTMGHGLEKYVQRTGHKMHISFTDGKRRPQDPTQASKLASECGIHIRNHLRVATHWKMYKTNDYKKAIPAAITSIAGKFDMNANDEVARATCTNIIKDGIRQQRYRLKSKYFNNVPISEVLSKGPPPRVSPEDWAKLVEKWTDPKHKETCEKNKINREQVNFTKLQVLGVMFVQSIL
ncbi:uncharacterized protein LOC107304726 [Oryza brachyantha]|uniref:uncharacterized protein LOC107304726 n=1 Tax=Oryza brachyantha TaxID=4533 RepID=UPI001AD9B20D|nr:uncharacterized protein LOC107304726 [Oryza brachyantha]